jgi:hypothetical protein
LGAPFLGSDSCPDHDAPSPAGHHRATADSLFWECTGLDGCSQ